LNLIKIQVRPWGVLQYTYFYNHARRLRLEKLLLYIPVLIYISRRHSSWTPGVFYTYFYNYNHAHRLRLEKLLLLELSRSPNGFFKVLLDPGGGFTSETAARRFQK
jgi:hypothetical protein